LNYKKRKIKSSFLRPGGPMKCTASGTIWCHITCALWLPELKFVDHAKMVGREK
jgi:hypothetical protein